MIVVSDTSPITALLTIDKIELLSEIYGQVRIPQAVADELSVYHGSLPDFIIVGKVALCPLLKQLQGDLDKGEAEAIVLAKELNADILLMDETLGREAARKENLPVIGLMGVLLIAKKKKLIESISELIEALESKAGFYLSRQVKAKILEAAGE